MSFGYHCVLRWGMGDLGAVYPFCVMVSFFDVVQGCLVARGERSRLWSVL